MYLFIYIYIYVYVYIHIHVFIDLYLYLYLYIFEKHRGHLGSSEQFALYFVAAMLRACNDIAVVLHRQIRMRIMFWMQWLML